MVQEHLVVVPDLLLKEQVLESHILFGWLLKQNLEGFKVDVFVLGHDGAELDQELLLLGVGLEFALYLDLVVFAVLYAKLKQGPHAHSELLQISIHLPRQLSLGHEYLYLFLPLARRQPIQTEVNLLAEYIVLLFAFIVVGEIVEIVVKLGH